jgi:hypothetical protein
MLGSGEIYIRLEEEKAEVMDQSAFPSSNPIYEGESNENRKKFLNLIH